MGKFTFGGVGVNNRWTILEAQMQDDLSIIVELVNKCGCDREKGAIERICAAIAEPAVTSTNSGYTKCQCLVPHIQGTVIMKISRDALCHKCGGHIV